MLIKIVDDDQVFVKKIKDIVYDNFKDIFLDYSIECITSNFEAQYFEKGDIFFLDIDLKEKNGIKIAEEIRIIKLLLLILMVKTAIQLSDIIYLESFLHEITIHTSSNFYKYSSTFNKMMSLINSTNIVRIHKSYAVNLFWVKEIYKEKLLLRNGVTLKIGKKYQQDVLASYKEYLLK